VQVQAALELSNVEAAGAPQRELEAISRAMESKELPPSAYAVAMAIQHKKSFSDYWA
jgi:predicted transcriptional regulator YdeE